jgi:cytosine/adenosine deaminase-related metal-dependent hydrolase
MILDHVDIVDVEQRTIVRDGQIVVTDGLIEHAGPRLASLPSGEVRDATGLVAVPGFINVHTHLWQHASRGLDTSGDLQSWAGIVHQFVHYATREEMYEATFVVARQALLSGFTTTSDFAAPYSEFTLDATNTAIRDAGMGGVVMWWNPAVFLPPEVKRREMRRFAQAIRPLRLWVAQGHAFLFELPARYEGIRLAAELDLGLSEHTLETIPGIRQAYGLDSGYLRRYGARLDPGDRARLEALVRPGAPPAVNRVHWMRRLARQVLQDADAAARLRPDDRALLERWADLPASFSVAAVLDFLGAFDLAHPYVMIHSVWADDGDLALFTENGVMVAHNPESNMRLSSGIAPVWQMLDQNITVGLGTDGAASNDGINVFSAMRAAWNLRRWSCSTRWRPTKRSTHGRSFGWPRSKAPGCWASPIGPVRSAPARKPIWFCSPKVRSVCLRSSPRTTTTPWCR